MAESKKSRWLELVIIPLLVGVVLVIFSFILPILFEKEKEISYIIDPPSAYLTEKTTSGLKVKINDVNTVSLYAYKVSFWNSGDIPLKKLPIRYTFDVEEEETEFQIFNVIHETESKSEFGQIREEGSDATSKRFIYPLLNPDERETATFLSNAMGIMSFDTKAESLSVKQVQPFRGEKLIEHTSVIIGITASLLALIIRLSYLKLTQIFQTLFTKSEIKE